MPKLTLTFNLPEEKTEAKIASNSGSYYSALWEINQYCFNLVDEVYTSKDPEYKILQDVLAILGDIDLDE
jgi:hypothetical protein